MATRTLLADLALEHRGHNAIHLRWHQAARTATRTIDQCDVEHQTSSKEQTTRILALCNRDCLSAHRDVRLIGTPGTGKTCLAQGRASAACKAPIKGRFPTALARINHLSAAEADHALFPKLQHDATPALLVGDELGARSLGQQGSPLCFQVIRQRPQRTSTVMTTTLPLAAWGKVCDSTTGATAIADRLVYNAEGLSLGGSSSRSTFTSHRRTTEAKGGSPCPSWPPTPFCGRFSSDNQAPVRPHDAWAHFQTGDFGLLFGRW